MIVLITLLPLAFFIFVKRYTKVLIEKGLLDIGDIKVRKADIDAALVLMLKGLYAGIGLLWLEEALRSSEPVSWVHYAAILIEILLLLISIYFIVAAVRRLYSNNEYS
jgi:hypothetical protein